MNTNEIIEKLNSNEYDFLRNNEHLGKNIIYLTTGGSHSYGTNVETSDLDIRGIAIENKSELLGFQHFEQFENRETDTTIYGLHKVMQLMLSCNPNVIEMLGTKEEHVFTCNNFGKMIRDNVDIFLSKKAIHSFGGYATAQLRRLQNALARDSYPQPEKEKHILETMKTQMMTMPDRYKELNPGDIELYIDKSEKDDYETEIFMNINIKNYPLRDFKNIYTELSETIRNYDKLNGRNRKKDDLHLNKHAMHLIRLLIEGTEILEGKGINTYRENDRDLLLDIRHGKYTFEEIFQMVDDYEAKFKYAADNSSLPSKPDYYKAEELLMSIYDKYLIN